MERTRFLYIVLGLFLVVIVTLALVVFLAPDSELSSLVGDVIGFGSSRDSFTVSLVSPGDGFVSSQRSGSFNYLVVGGRSSYACNLYLNNSLRASGIARNNVLSTLGASNIGYGVWKWKVVCYAGWSSKTSETRTITILSVTTTTTTTTTSRPTTTTTTRITTTTTSTTSTTTSTRWGSSIAGFRFYPKDHIWNVPIDTLPVHPMSNTYIAYSDSSSFMWIGAVFPINVVDSGQATQYLASTTHPEFSDNIPYPIPGNAQVETIEDAHMLIVNPNTNELYEMFYAHQASDGTWSAFAAMKFNLSSYALRFDHQVSTDAAGLAITPGLIRYDELASGSINHSMRVAMYTSGAAHVWPARADGVVASSSYPPLGQRFRLKASFNTSGYSPHSRIILEAWKKYGFMLADQTGDMGHWVISADNDIRWADEAVLWNEMGTVHASEFEAVDVSSLMINKDSGQARVL